MGAGGCRLCWGNRQTLPDGEGLGTSALGGQSFLRVLSRVTTSGQGWGQLGLVRPGVDRPCHRRTEAWGPSLLATAVLVPRGQNVVAWRPLLDGGGTAAPERHLWEGCPRGDSVMCGGLRAPGPKDWTRASHA